MTPRAGRVGRRYCAKFTADGFGAGAAAAASAFNSGGGLAASAEDDIGVHALVPSAALPSATLPSVTLPSMPLPSVRSAAGLPSLGFAIGFLPSVACAAAVLRFAFF